MPVRWCSTSVLLVYATRNRHGQWFPFNQVSTASDHNCPPRRWCVHVKVASCHSFRLGPAETQDIPGAPPKDWLQGGALLFEIFSHLLVSFIKVFSCFESDPSYEDVFSWQTLSGADSQDHIAPRITGVLIPLHHINVDILLRGNKQTNNKTELLRFAKLKAFT